jgi:signal transduction histidine kinase
MRTTLRLKLAAALAVIAFVAAAVSSAVVFELQETSIIEDRRDRLSVIATVQQARTEAWTASAQQGVALVASRTRFRALLRDIQNRPAGPPPEEAVSEIVAILTDAGAASPDVLAVHALDRSGVVVGSTTPALAGVDLSDEPYITGARRDRPSLDHVARTEDGLAGIHGAVVELDGDVLGWVVLEQSWQPVLDVISDTTALGDTGETLLVRRDPVSGAVVTLAPLRQAPDSALTAVPVDGEDSLVGRAATGPTSDAIETTDYRGHDVVASTRPVEGTDWGLVVKQDRAEILAATDDLRNTLVLATGAATLLAAAIAFLMARQLTHHIKDLTAVARRVARGDRTARADVKTTDEMAELAVAFNRMTDDLVGHEQELETQKTQLESFLYVSSHDLKTPLRSISSFSQLLRIDYGADLDDRANRYLLQIENGATRTIDLIDELLAYVQVDHTDHGFEELNLAEAAGEARALLEPVIAEKGAAVTIQDLDTIEGSHPLLVQLFQNLIGNSLKFSRPDTASVVKVSTTAGTNGDGHDFSFVVADNGVGVPEEYRQRVFAPFERLQSVDEVPGSGLGLAVCERIVSVHGGTLEFVDSPLGGAAVRVTLARTRGQSLANARSSSLSSAPGEGQGPAGRYSWTSFSTRAKK